MNLFIYLFILFLSFFFFLSFFLSLYFCKFAGLYEFDFVAGLYIYIYIYIFTFTFGYLADTFIQSDLQMRTIEAIKTNKRATICKRYDESQLA